MNTLNGVASTSAPADPKDPSLPLRTSSPPRLSPATLAIHADDILNSDHITDVAPSLHVASTYRYPSSPADLRTISDLKPGEPIPHIYSRISNPNTTRLETLLSSLLKGPTLTYSSGLASFHALLVHLNPKVVAIGDGYHGCHGVLGIYRKLTSCVVVDVHNPATWKGTTPDGKEYALSKGDLVHLETPLNPSGVAFDIEKYASWARERGAWLSIDATFAPPPLLEPFKFGADYVMHSGTKYFGGHSDMLCGVLSVETERRGKEAAEKAYWELFKERFLLGGVVGSLEGWLGVRSLRTLELRVERQSRNAEELVRWLDGLASEGGGEVNGSGGEEREASRKVVWKAEHASLQARDLAKTEGKDNWLARQMPNGFGPVFGLYLAEKEMSKRLPSKLQLFHHATSLGGVESLIEWRRMSDDKVDDRLLRVSVGVENVEDLKADFLQGFKALVAELKP
ncbi:Cys/Met metabolism PLP-dependent enzyme-like protein 1 [Elsinoe fawcettii]|nr:Cys/Met metabolism PLP-dependent enzyme-like protein 1 [Elsinoe fawcettii]